MAGKKSKNQTRKVVAIFSGYYLPSLGGVERYTNKLSEELVRKGYDVIIVTSNHADLEPVEKDKFMIYRLPTYKLFRSRYPIIKKDRKYKDLLNRLKKEKIDFIICNTRFHLTTPAGIKLAKSINKEAILIEHGSSHFTVGILPLDFLGKIYEHLLTRIAIKPFVTRYYGVSGRCNAWLKHFGINAKGIFYNSVDARAYDDFKNRFYAKTFRNKIVITYAGRLIKEKGIELLLESFTTLAKTHGNIELIVAGDGPLLEDLEKKYDSPNIHFEGKLDYSGVMSLFNSTDIFCHPSMYPEGLPTSILEAGLMGCAVIATDRGGTVEVINSPEYGIIIEENLPSLTRALEELITNPQKVESMKKKLQERVVREFSWENTASKVVIELEANK